MIGTCSPRWLTNEPSHIGLPSHAGVVRVYLDSHVLGSKTSHVSGEVATNPRRDAGARRLSHGHARLSDSAIACPRRSRRLISRENKIDDQAETVLLLPFGDVLGQLLLQSGCGKARAEAREGETTKAYARRNIDQRNMGAGHVGPPLPRGEHIVDGGAPRPAARRLADMGVSLGIRAMGSARPIQIIGPFHSAAKSAAASLLDCSQYGFPRAVACCAIGAAPNQSLSLSAAYRTRIRSAGPFFAPKVTRIQNKGSMQI